MKQLNLDLENSNVKQPVSHLESTNVNQAGSHLEYILSKNLPKELIGKLPTTAEFKSIFISKPTIKKKNNE